MSNAEDWSSSVNKDTCLLSRPKRISFAVLEVMSVYYGETGMQIERCREDCYDLSNLQAAGEKLSHKFFR